MFFIQNQLLFDFPPFQSDSQFCVKIPIIICGPEYHCMQIRIHCDVNEYIRGHEVKGAQDNRFNFILTNHDLIQTSSFSSLMIRILANHKINLILMIEQSLSCCAIKINSLEWRSTPDLVKKVPSV